MTPDMSDEVTALRQQLDRERRRADALRQALEAVKHAHTGASLLHDLVASGVDLLEGATGALWLEEKRNGATVLVPTGEQNIPELRAFASEVLRVRQPLLWNGWAAALLRSEEHIGGVLAVQAHPSHHFTTEDLETLAEFAQHAAIAIDNARLFEEERRRTVRSTIINRVSRQIAESLSLQIIFQTAVEAIHHQLNLDHVSAGIVDPDDPNMLALLAHAGVYELPVPPNYRQSIDVGLVGAAARSRQRLLIANPLQDPRFLPLLADAELRAALVQPLVVGERLLGILNIESTRPIDEDEADAIGEIADQLAVAMDRATLFARTERALDETRLLYETSQRVSTALTEDDVISTYLEYVSHRKRFACGVMLYQFDTEGQRVGRILWGYWSPGEGLVITKQREPYIPDATVPLLDGGESVLIEDATDDPRVYIGFRHYMSRFQWRGLAVIPLMVGGERIGIVWLTHQTVYQWSESDLQPYQITAALLATAIDHRRQLLRFGEQNSQLAVLEERRRLARELHDSVTQSLFSMSLLSQVIPELWLIDQAEAQANLAQIRDLTRNALAEMRALLFELRPAALGKQGLARALEEYAQSFTSRTGLQVTVTASGVLALPPDVEHCLFRIAQEALTNAARHAQAQHVHVSLLGGTPLRLAISDNGCGFALEAMRDGRFGLLSMRERAASINARLDIRSAPGEGSEIAVIWPQT